MTHDEYIKSVRNNIGTIAIKMHEESIEYLEGSIELFYLFHEAELKQDDPDFLVFIAISSETDHLPLTEKVRSNWSQEALIKLEPEIRNTREWARNVSQKQLKSIIERFAV